MVNVKSWLRFTSFHQTGKSWSGLLVRNGIKGLVKCCRLHITALWWAFFLCTSSNSCSVGCLHLCLLFFFFPSQSLTFLFQVTALYYVHKKSIVDVHSVTCVHHFGGAVEWFRNISLLLDWLILFTWLVHAPTFCYGNIGESFISYFIYMVPCHPHHLSETASRGLWNVICFHITAFWWAF